jgi:hypothetical protein
VKGRTVPASGVFVSDCSASGLKGRTVPASGVFVSLGSTAGLGGRTAPGLGASVASALGMGVGEPAPVGGGSGNPQLPCDPAEESPLGGSALGRVGLALSSEAAGVRSPPPAPASGEPRGSAPRGGSELFGFKRRLGAGLPQTQLRARSGHGQPAIYQSAATKPKGKRWIEPTEPLAAV